MKEFKPWSFCATPAEKCTMNCWDENGCMNRIRVRTTTRELRNLQIEAKRLGKYSNPMYKQKQSYRWKAVVLLLMVVAILLEIIFYGSIDLVSLIIILLISIALLLNILNK